MNGVNKVVYQLANRQAQAGKNVQVWGIAENTEHTYDKRSFTTVLFQKLRNPFAISSKLKQAIADAEDTVFHIHGAWVPTFWAVAKCIAKYQKKAVLTPHGGYNTIAVQKSGWKKKVYFTIFEKSVLNTMAAVHCIGASEKEGLSKFYPNNKQVLLPYGFDKPKTLVSTSSEGKPFTVGFVGRIDIHTKGLDLLIKAFSKFHKDKNAKLWIVGDSAEMPALKKMIATHELNDSVIVHGSKYGDDKNDLIQKMTVFTHPSRNEGLPTAVLEAASFGVPSIVTEATNVGSYLEKHNAGLCVPNEDVNALASAFETVYIKWKNNEMDLYKKGTQTMLDNEFEWDGLVERYDELYN
jgi:glycosyltransferase involved in cell wall biosynthesis